MSNTWTSPYPPLEPDGRPFAEIALESATERVDAPALLDAVSGEAVSFAELAERVERMAGELSRKGLRPGDVVAIRVPNSPAWGAAALGASRAGGVVTGVPPGATGDDVAVRLALTGAAIEIGPAGEVRTLPSPRPARNAASLAALPCSSGTTGRPKPVMLTHANLAAGIAQVRTGLAFEPRDVVLGVAPFAHVMGLVGALAAPLAAGATVVTLGRFEPPALLAAIERHRVTVLIVPPPVVAALASLRGGLDLSSLEFVVCGGAPLAPQLQARFAARHPHVTIGQGYGMTETTLAIPIPDRRTGTPPGTAGRLAPSTELRVIDPATGRDQGEGAPGELLVRGPQVTPGYLDRPVATAELIDRDGWLHTGDLGFVDAAGYVHVVDRLKELIKVNARQVAPAELEALLLSRPDVADAAVVARPDERTGEVPVAVVVPRGALEPAELVDWVAARVASYKRVAGVVLAERIPRSPAGKILRRELRAAASGRR